MHSSVHSPFLENRSCSYLLQSLPVPPSASSAFKALAGTTELIVNKADRLDSNAVVWVFISYSGSEFENHSTLE